MTDIKVNKIIWDAVSDVEKQQITSHLREYGVLKPGQNIVADPLSLSSAITCRMNDVSMGAVGCTRALGLDWLCRAICDSTKSETDCPLYGQSLAACFATIVASRESKQGD